MSNPAPAILFMLFSRASRPLKFFSHLALALQKKGFPVHSWLEILRFNIGNLLSNFLETFAEIGVAMKIQGTEYLLLCRIIVMIYTVFVEICLALLRPANDSFLFLKLTKLSHLLLSTGTDFLGIGTCSIIVLTLRVSIIAFHTIVLRKPKSVYQTISSESNVAPVLTTQ